jgi:hypothetical protein
MNKKILVVLCLGLTACGSESSNEYKVKSAFLDTCIRQESSTRPADQAKAYCGCAADKVFSSSDISEDTKNLMLTMNDKDSRLYQQSDAAKVKGLLMSCYTAKFYKK